MIDRIDGRAPGAETPIGIVPRRSELNMEGLEIPSADVDAVLAVDREEWTAELPLIREFFDRFGSRLPREMDVALAELARRLRAPNP
jgi:phosphoenolpyruvate carboxykinase (GTP)